MPKNRQGNNKLEPAAEASANANLAVDADINDQHVVLNAIASLKRDLVEKIEEKAIAQSAELQIQTTQIDMLKVSLGLDKPPTLDRAHRALRSRATQDGLPPRAFIVKCHYLSEKESLLKKAIEMKSVTTPDGDQIRLLPDFTQAVSKQRAAFTEVRGLLRNCEGVRYGLKYPAILIITTSGGHEASFSDPKLAKEFVLNKVVRKAS
ncbi:LINE-1 retrotransposable element ORF1 protein [Dissostichus eleginoides]|uniref:LINE-1 retrotransposable element ORF1 protein n=1 Tax=Dissostichus eleginoides TaxID=100907 RepID=A0AAD9C2Y3_DISEL|nr:LINE-1 retrotransposable element ORF1 protein [Dissostichus eleginoides]